MKRRLTFLKFIVAVFAVSMAGASVALAQTDKPKIPEKYTVRVGPYSGESGGADTSMYRTIYIDFVNPVHKDEQVYHVHYYLNDRLEGKMSASVPFTIQRNFQGQRPGIYTFKVQLLTDDFVLLAESSTEFELKRKKP